MKKAVNIILLAFYAFGTFLLPMGDFSLLKELPQMYQHCKATEDKDLSIFEFLTEHVSGIGQMMEATEHETDQEEDGDKPHSPDQFHFKQQTAFYYYQEVKKSPPIKPTSLVKTKTELKDQVYISDYISKIFRPPIIT